MASYPAGDSIQGGGGDGAVPPGFKVPSGPPPYPTNGPPPFPPTGPPPYQPGGHPMGPPPQYAGHPYPTQYQQPLPGTMTVVVGSSLGHDSARVTCGHCRLQIETKVESSASLIAWVSCGAICLLGGFFGCCLIPFCISPCYDVEHSCPNCGAHLGRRSALS